MNSRAGLLPIWRDPTLRLASGAIFLLGALVASIVPHLSLLATRVFGLSDAQYSAMMFGSAFVTVLASIWVGVVTDQRENRRQMAIFCSVLLIAALALVWSVGTPAAFLVAHVLVLPFARTMFGQVFALARLATSDYPETERSSAMTIIRAFLALPFITILPLWALAFAWGIDLIRIYAVTTPIAILILILLWTRWHKDGQTPWLDKPSGLSAGKALAELLRARVLSRLTIIGAVQASPTLFLVLLGLILTSDAGRTTSDVALFAGIVAGLEVPFILTTSVGLRYFTKSSLIAIGAVVHAGFMLVLPVLAPTSWFWFLALPAGIGAAIILSVPVSYLQDLMSDRPGAGGALLSVNQVISQLFAAFMFTVGTMVGGYGTVAAICAVVVATAGLGLWLCDRKGN